MVVTLHARRPLLAILLCSAPFAASTNADGTSFLEANKLKPDVVTLPSGLQYKVIKTGAGKEHPLPGTTCSCHYEGRTAQEFVKTPKGKVPHAQR